MRKMYNHMRNSFVKVTVAGLVLAMSACNTSSSDANSTATAEETGNRETNSEESYMVYLGTSGADEQENIFMYSLDTETGALAAVGAAKGGAKPTYLAFSEDRKFLYAVNEKGDFGGEKSGAVTAFSVDQQSGQLTMLNQVASKGTGPCHVSVDEKNGMVLVANYGGGNVAALPMQPDGSLAAAAGVGQHKGSGPNKDRQEGPHAHFITPDPANKFAFAVDLGTDQVLGYRYQDKKLVPNEPAVAYTVKAGSGPRHMAFHPNGRFAFLINELNSTMVALSYNADKGTFSEVQTVATIPADFKENNQCSAVKVSPDGKFLYGANRGHNSIVVYAINQSTGELKQVQHENVGGDWPRDFTIDLTGNILLVANERSNNLVTFKIDKASGKLTPSGHEVQVEAPMCPEVVPAFK
ncbi:lactonase family protein [Pontibacter qinzhouensis]|uniref:Lactonase family protein n=1 Tax=Pontibacter qinzhouensis TaxID=2603253 RepID=A0A5C8JKB5_9BACT|nr:lactonase family protein [Pontibacter qinzhouensis]TXK37486.1 lactonase family protein [Pontibacter qinzhouensis]